MEVIQLKSGYGKKVSCWSYQDTFYESDRIAEVINSSILWISFSYMSGDFCGQRLEDAIANVAKRTGRAEQDITEVLEC